MQNHLRSFDLSRFALVEIAGSEAFAFLHGQIPGDLNDLNARGWMFSAWCQPTGRVICTFIVFRQNHVLFLMLPATMKDRIIRRLAMYVLRADVSIRDASADHVLLGLQGINIRDTDIFGPWTRSGMMLTAESCSVLELWGLTPRCLLICKKDHRSLPDKIQQACNQENPVAWNLLDIEAGIPWITEPVSAAFLPQMLNLEQIQGLSYQKGCYPGQEVIARLHYRGELKQKMFLGEGHGDILPAPGTVLLRTDTGAKAGDVIDAAPHPDGSFRLLTVANINEASALLHLQKAPGTSITLQALHYPSPPAT